MDFELNQPFSGNGQRIQSTIKKQYLFESSSWSQARESKLLLLHNSLWSRRRFVKVTSWSSFSSVTLWLVLKVHESIKKVEARYPPYSLVHVETSRKWCGSQNSIYIYFWIVKANDRVFFFLLLDLVFDGGSILSMSL